MVICVERLGRDRVLYCHIDSATFLVGIVSSGVPHVAVEGDVLVESPLR